ncbi:hypothetical protein NL676_033974 [Syzygium grande]|nr:hypothetical protein NL676_033974 [Syzygium grande]
MVFAAMGEKWWLTDFTHFMRNHHHRHDEGHGRRDVLRGSLPSPPPLAVVVIPLSVAVPVGAAARASAWSLDAPVLGLANRVIITVAVVRGGTRRKRVAVLAYRVGILSRRTGVAATAESTVDSAAVRAKRGFAFEVRVIILVTATEFRGGLRYGCTGMAIADRVATGAGSESALRIRVGIVKAIAAGIVQAAYAAATSAASESTLGIRIHMVTAIASLEYRSGT